MSTNTNKTLLEFYKNQLQNLEKKLPSVVKQNESVQYKFISDILSMTADLRHYSSEWANLYTPYSENFDKLYKKALQVREDYYKKVR